MIKSSLEIQELFENWKSDPCWDLADTEDFEAHKNELAKMQAEQEKDWENARTQKLKTRALTNDLTVDHQREVDKFASNKDFLTEKAADGLVHYFARSISKMSNDDRAEIRDIADYMVQAAISGMMAEMLKTKKISTMS